MTQEEKAFRLKQLDWEEQRLKMQLQLYVQIPSAFSKQGKKWLNQQINLGLDKLRAIQQEQKQLLDGKPPEKP